MTYAFYLSIGLFVAIVQTTVLPTVGFLAYFYDLMLPFVIYVGFYKPMREGIPAAIIFGLMMDGLSGAPFGLYLSSYGWLYAGIVLLKRIIIVRNPILLSLVAALGVLIQNGIWLAVENLILRKPGSLAILLKILFFELIFAMITGPALILLASYLQKKWDATLRRVFVQSDADFK